MTSGEINFERTKSSAELFFHRHLLPENILSAKDVMEKQLTALKNVNERDGSEWEIGEQSDFLKRVSVDSDSKA